MQITIREPGSAITHFIAMMMAVFAAVPLLVKAGVQSGQENFLAMAIFMGSMILLYGASATYHSVDLTGKSLRVFRKLDHMMIFVLIAGSSHRCVSLCWAVSWDIRCWLLSGALPLSA
jgi:hemolysin III